MVLVILVFAAPTSPAPAAVSAKSVNVVIIGGITLDSTCGGGNAANVMYFSGGGCLPVTGPAGELGDFAFTPMAPSAVSAASLGPFDTAVLNVASYAMACNTNTLTSQQKADLVAFAASGKKLIIYDSECPPVDYSWMPFPFTTNNPGAMGAQGTLTIVEDNTLSTKVGDPGCLSGDPRCINATHLSTATDAIGDMNVMTTYDPNWCVDMSGTNALNVTGPVHTYAKYPAGTDAGLIIYNGMDQDYQYSYSNDPQLRKIWLQELQQPFNPSNLPCGVTVVGIALTPAAATNTVGQNHTVTATLKDLLGNPQSGISVTFTVTAGPSAGLTGTGITNADGQATFTYTSTSAGIDQIQACFTNQAGGQVCSQVVTKEWTTPVSGGESPYIALVGNDTDANPFYNSPKYAQFTYNQNLFGVPVCAGTFPTAYNIPYHPQYGAGCEQFRSQMQTIQPEVCDSRGAVTGVGMFNDRGNDNAVTRAGNTGWYEWYIRLPKKPSGEINLVLQCGVLKPNTWAFYEYRGVSLCAAETGERVGQGICSRQEVDPGVNPVIVAALPKIKAMAYPGPYNSFTPFNLTAFRNPGTYNPYNSGVLVNGAAGQVLNGADAGTRILLKSCMDKTIITKLPVTGELNALGQEETDLEIGDIIYIRMDIPRQNSVDVYCHEQSAKVMGIGEGPF